MSSEHQHTVRTPTTGRHLPPGEDPTCARAVEAYRHALQVAPTFAPHASVVFELKEELGKGGMGSVHRVVDHRLGREAALKLMHQEGADSAGVERFLREARITARLEHPAIPPVYESGTDASGRHYMLMKVIGGQPLSQLIRSGADERELLGAVVKVGEAIAYAHSRGVIHRDLKPDNIMVGGFGEVMVLDWGLAREEQGGPDESILRQAAVQFDRSEAKRAGLTLAGSVMGTPGYMSPEQAGGDQVDARTDVFALGAILVEVLTGRPPIEGKTVINKLHATMTGKIALPRDRRGDVPRDLDAIAAKALAVEADERTRSASLFVDDLKAYLGGGEVSAHRYGVGERLTRAARKHPGRLLGAASLFVFAGIAGVLVSQLQRAQETATRAKIGKAEADASLEVAKSKGRQLIKVSTAVLEARNGRKRKVTDLVAEARGEGELTRELLQSVAVAYEILGMWPEASSALEESKQLALDRGEKPYQELFELHVVALLTAPHEGLHRTGFLDQLDRLGSVENEHTLLSQAFRAFNEGRDEALVQLAQAANSERESLWAHYLLGVGELRCGRFQLATEALDGAIALEPSFGLAYLARAQARQERARAGEFPLHEVLDDYNAAVRLMPRAVEALLGRMQVNAKLGRHPEVDTDWEVAHSLDAERAGPRRTPQPRRGPPPGGKRSENKPFDTAAEYIARAAKKGKKGDLRGAIRDCERALKVDPNNAQAFLFHANARASLKEFDTAETDFERALNLDPAVAATVYLNRGIMYKSAGQPAKARADWERFLAKFPRHPMAGKVEKALSKLNGT